MLRGSALAKVDDKGRVKIPNLFRTFIEETYGRDVFVTSDSGACVQVFPLAVWIEKEKKIAALPSMDPSVLRYQKVVNYFGQPASLDDQGRLLIHPLLRSHSGMQGEVTVIGQQIYLEIWNREKFEAILGSDPFTDEDRRVLSSHGI
ncbi:MAG TPA: division/cell wall cluster transcriptional repressor MraZ [Candidatus Polarisedimenticolia bacterium]|nr:division/cell wall cluster transcriptional repressor MraZ [Candidatus Polarisedimenticolia bacterium]